MRESKLIGHNTDGLGFLNALRDAGVNPRGMNVVLLGAGGAARAVAFAIAPQVRSLTILNRHVTRAEQLAQDVRSSFQGLTLDVARIDALARAQLIVNATSAGMAPRMDESPLPDDAPIPPGAVVYDLIYSPRETKLLKMARASGAVTLNGLGMLVHQGAEAFQLWTGLKAPLEIMRRAVEENETVAEKDG
jgi:shikimate dehydrogenase